MFKRKKYDYDLIVIGSGAGGSVGAHYAASLGKKVALFESGDIGGECPNWACIPTKALLHAAEVYSNVQEAHLYGINIKAASFDFEHIHKWKNVVVNRTGTSHGAESFEKAGIHLIPHKASFISPHEVEANGRSYSASKFIVATGSSVFIPPVEGLKETGFITFKQAVDFKKSPKSMFIIGGGAVACEFAHIYSTFGTQVTIAARTTLLSNEDKEVVDLVQALFEAEGIRVATGASVDSVEKKGSKKKVFYTIGTQKVEILVDEVLIATGKVPNLSFAPDKVGIITNRSGIAVDSYLQTSVPHIYAAGDVVGPYLFTHSGYYQSRIAAHNAFSNSKIRVNYRTVPRCVFISPEVASVGLSETDAKQEGIKTKVGIAAISILGRANTSNELDGFVKVVTDKNGTIIGAAIVAPRAGEMIHELALAVQLRTKASVIANMIHAYPTFSEAVKIACSMVS